MNSNNFDQAKQYVMDHLGQELSPGLFYHGLPHTCDDVVPAAQIFADGEQIHGEALYLLLSAAWFHDFGFIETRTGHEAVGARTAAQVLPGFGYNQAEIHIIQGIIMATVVPQAPTTILERIMADADLDVLGRDDYWITNDNLRRELAFFGRGYTDFEWYSSQLKFLETHTYFTATARRLRTAGQSKNAIELRQKLEEIGTS
jgi:uncharacterized protein